MCRRGGGGRFVGGVWGCGVGVEGAGRLCGYTRPAPSTYGVCGHTASSRECARGVKLHSPTL